MKETKYSLSQVNEAIIEYVRVLEKPHSKRIASLKGLIEDRLIAMQAIRAGIPYKLFTIISAFMPFSEIEWADFLGLSSKSLQRFKAKKNFVFKPIHSEKILELAEVILLGHQVFGNMGKLNTWLTSSSIALGGLKPMDLLQDSFGKELVMDELRKIDQGAFG